MNAIASPIGEDQTTGEEETTGEDETASENETTEEVQGNIFFKMTTRICEIHKEWSNWDVSEDSHKCFEDIPRHVSNNIHLNIFY